jgi:hypothetical protein
VVEFFVDDEVGQAARCHHRDRQVLGIGLDSPAQRPAQHVAPARRGLVGRVVGVDHDRHERGDPLAHHAQAGEGERVAEAAALPLYGHLRHVELVDDERVD